MAQKFANAARGALDSALSDSATSLTIISGGSLFPVANTGASAIGPAADWFKLVIQDDTNIEIIFVRTHTSGSLTFSDILRGQEGTTARAFVAGSVVGCRPTAGDSADFGARQPATSVSDTPPANPVSGQEWFDGTSGISYIWVDDGTSGQWVDPTALLIAASSGGDGGGAFSGSLLVLDNVLAADVTIGGSQSALAMSPTIPSGRTAAIEDGGLLLVFDRDMGEESAAENVGAGYGFYAQKSGGRLQFRSLVPGNGIGITSDDASVTVSYNGFLGEANTASSVGVGAGLFAQKVGSDLQFKSIVPGAGITLTPSADAVTISFSGAVGEVNTASNVGTGIGQVFKLKSSTNLQLKTIKQGANITVTNNADDITISSAPPVIISEYDPGAVGAGVIWVTP